MRIKDYSDDSCSLDNVKRLLISSIIALKIQGINLEFITKDRLRRPSFGFIHTIIKLSALHITSRSNWLYNESELDVKCLKSRKSKIVFLFKMISFISVVSDEPIYLFISPAKILCGKEVKKTRWFLLRLAQLMSNGESLIRAYLNGETQVDLRKLYQKAVQTRMIFSRFQCAIRKRYENKHTSDKHNILHESSSNQKNIERVKKKRTEVKGLKENFVEKKVISQDDSTKSFIGTPVHSITTTIFQDENDDHNICGKKLVDEKYKKDATVFQKKVKKIKIKNGIIHQEEYFVEDTTEHQAFEETQKEDLSKTKDVSELESELRKKLNKVKQKEIKLKQQVELTNAKEELLKIHEERVKKLAENLRRKQEQIKEEERRNSSELDMMRLQLAENAIGSFEKRPLEYFDSKNLEFGDDLLRKACANPTITDLRLALERQQRKLMKRVERVGKAEKELRLKLEALNVISSSDLSCPQTVIRSTNYATLTSPHSTLLASITKEEGNGLNLLGASNSDDAPIIHTFPKENSLQYEDMNHKLPVIEEE